MTKRAKKKAKKKQKKKQAKAQKINSRTKGKTGELEFAKFLKSRGVPARRGQQFKGTPDSPDVVTGLDDVFHFEVKRVESLSLYKALSQASSDAGKDQIPVVAHRRNGKPWVIALDASCFFTLLGYGLDSVCPTGESSGTLSSKPEDSTTPSNPNPVQALMYG